MREHTEEILIVDREILMESPWGGRENLYRYRKQQTRSDKRLGEKKLPRLFLNHHRSAQEALPSRGRKTAY